MGVLYYSTDPPVEIPDRLLAHVKVVVTAKLRRNEKFTVSFAHGDGSGGASSTIWLGPALPLRFEFDTDRAEPLDPVLLQQLASQANTTRGLVLHLDMATPLAVAGE